MTADKLTRSEECTECGKVHEFPTPKFLVGQQVRLTNGDGYHHKNKVGQIATILAVEDFLVMPCDPVEYRTTFGHGNVQEDRLELV